MTAKYFTARGIKGEIENICAECMLRRDLYGQVDLKMIVCENENSDHFGHVMGKNHPACDGFETVTLTEIAENTEKKQDDC